MWEDAPDRLGKDDPYVNEQHTSTQSEEAQSKSSRTIKNFDDPFFQSFKTEPRTCKLCNETLILIEVTGQKKCKSCGNEIDKTHALYCAKEDTHFCMDCNKPQQENP